MKNQQKEALDRIAQKLYDKKGFNILALDVRSISSITDYFLIAEGTVERHVQALSREVQDVLKDTEFSLFHVDGEKTGDWIVIDSGSILVHLFTSELRQKYSLEELWSEAEIVDLNIKLETEGRR